VPLRRNGRLRKRWRYVGAFAEEVLVCAARVEVGPLGQTFWAVSSRDDRRLWERTRLRPPGARGEVRMDGPLVQIHARDLRASLTVGEGEWVESVCPTPEGNYVWTRKALDVPVDCEITAGERSWRVQARGVVDESCGYHPRHTVWSWSAGVGRTTDGHSVGWNLVEGINDPPERSERAIWVDGKPFEPGPVTFEDLDAIGFDDGSHLAFAAETERQKSENKLMVRYSYRQPFGSFSGTLPGGLALERGLGVMEHHDAVW